MTIESGMQGGNRATVEERLSQLERETDRKLTFAEHMSAQIVYLPSVYGADTDIDIRLDPERIKARPLGVLCVEVRNLDAPDQPGSLGGSVPWAYRSPRPGEAYVRILNLPGLASATRYGLGLLVVGG